LGGIAGGRNKKTVSSFNDYIKSIKPTKKGLLALALCLVIIPLVADMFLLAVNIKMHEQIWMSGFMLSAYVKYLPALIIYLLLFFVVWTIFKTLFKK
jgi:ABC-type arginine transport system permease subunit